MEQDRRRPRRDAEGSGPDTIDAEYRCDYAYHAQMEPLNAIARWRPVEIFLVCEICGGNDILSLAV